MVDVSPFQGLRYNKEKISGYDVVVAPPYDVISPEEQQDLHQKNLYNIVRLILGVKKETDQEFDNVYARAHEALEAWREQGVLVAEGMPAIYAYTQSWDNMERRGFIARLRTESYDTGKVLPHEFTLGGPKADRLALMKATGSVLSPIFCLYHDPSKTVESRLFESEPTAHVVDVTDKDNVRHRFWPVMDPQDIQAVQELLKDKSVLIADGHHRYETAVAYRDWRRQENGQQQIPHGDLPWDDTMSFFTNMADEGLKIYPTHRVLTSLPAGWTQEQLGDAISQYFEPSDEREALFWIQTQGTFRQPYKLKPGVDLSAIPQPLRALDVALLDQFVFQGILQQSANDLKQQGHLQFVRDEQEVLSLIQSGALVLWVHAPSVQQVREICESGHRMPQKSTYFYPKLLSGLVLYYYGTGKQGLSDSLLQTEGAGLTS